MASNEKNFKVKLGVTTPKVDYTLDDKVITAEMLNLTTPTLSYSGSAGQLFSISDDLTGTIFSVNDISGIPSIEVNADGTVSLAEFDGNVGIGTSSPTQKLDVAGAIRTNDGIYSSTDLILGSNDTAVAYVKTSGEVGIGVDIPTNTLDVNGTFRARTVNNATGDFATVSATGILQKRTPAQTLADIGAAASVHTHTADQVQMNTDFELRDWYDSIQSAGRLSGGKITDNGNGTVSVAFGRGLIKAESSTAANGEECELGDCASISTTQYVTWSTVPSLALTDEAYNYIYYDGSTGNISATTDFYSIDFTRDFTVGRAYRSGTSVIARLCGTNIWNFNRRVQLFGEEYLGVVRARGLNVGSVGTRNITVSEGILWAEGVNRFVVTAFDSSGLARFTYWYRNGSGGWTQQINQSQINNTQYDNGSGTLQTLNPNRVGVHWVYVVHDSSIHVVFGQGNYQSGAAEAATPPTSIPGLLEAYATLVAKIRVVRGSNTLGIDSAFTQVFQTSGITDHNELANIGTYLHTQIDSHIDDATIHRVINDGATTTTNLWSGSKINTELGGKANTSHTHTKSQITDFAHTHPAGEVTGLATVATTGAYSDLTGIPSTFTPASHTHGNITNAGAIGTTTNLVVTTTTGGVLTTSSRSGIDSRSTFPPSSHTHPVSEVSDSTTLGQNLVKFANPGAIRFIRINADNTVTARTAADFRGDIGAGTSSTVGTVTSVGGTGTVAGITLSGTVTSSGNLTLGGALSTPVSTINDSTTVGQNLVKLTNPSAIRFIRINADNSVSALDAATFRGAIGAGTSSTTGTVTSVAAGNGLDFTTFTTSGSVVLGTPGTITGSSTNAVTTTSHTHALTLAAATFNNSGSGAASGTTFDGTTARTISYNTVGAAASSHTHPISEVTNLQTSLDDKADLSRNFKYSSYTLTDGNGWYRVASGSGGGDSALVRIWGLAGSNRQTNMLVAISGMGYGQLPTVNVLNSLRYNNNHILNFRVGSETTGVNWALDLELDGIDNPTTLHISILSNNFSAITPVFNPEAMEGSIVTESGRRLGGQASWDWKINSLIAKASGGADLTGALSTTGTATIGTVDNGTGDFVTATSGGLLGRRTAAQTLSDIGAAASSHTHGNITNAGAIGTTSDQVVTTTTSGVLTTSSRSGIDSRSTFPAASHTHTVSQITDFPTIPDAADFVTIATTQTITGQKTISDENLKYPFSSNTTVFNADPYDNRYSTLPVSSLAWHDMARWTEPYYEVSNDGSSWTPTATNKNLFSGKANQSITVCTTTQKFARWTWDTGVSYASINWFVIGHAWAASQANVRVLVEDSPDGSAWTTRHDSTGVRHSQPFFYKLSTALWQSTIRVTLENVSATGDVNLSSIRMLTARWGNQGEGRERELPYNWDANRNLITYGTLQVATLDDLAGDFITSSPTGVLQKRTAAQTLSDIGAAASSHTHTTSNITDLSSYTGLDSRYYTETEVDALIPTVNNATLTMNVSGTGLSGSQTFTANQSSAATFTVTSNATSANTASTIVARDGSGNFTAGTITSSGFVANALGAFNSPAYRFSSYSATGMYMPNANELGFSAGSGLRLNIKTNEIQSNVAIKNIGGTNSNPSYTFINDPDTGIFCVDSGVIALTTNGTERFRVNPSSPYVEYYNGSSWTGFLPLTGGTLTGGLTAKFGDLNLGDLDGTTRRLWVNETAQHWISFQDTKLTMYANIGTGGSGFQVRTHTTGSGFASALVVDGSGGTFLGDVTTTGGDLLGNGSRRMVASRSGDAWLRINDGGDHTSGVYFNNSVVRTDGQLQVGASGANFLVNGTVIDIPYRLRHTGDTDTYMEFGTNSIAFVAGNGTRITLNTNGAIMATAQVTGVLRIPYS